jgi:hypothetical protein
MFSPIHWLILLLILGPYLIAIVIANARRTHCDWTLAKAKSQVWVSIAIIVASQIVIFALAKPLSRLALLSTVLGAFGVFRLARAIYRRNDLAKTIISN